MPKVEEGRAIYAHDHTSRLGLRKSIPHPSDIICAVGITDNVDAGGYVERIVGVEVAPKDTFVKVRIRVRVRVRVVVRVRLELGLGLEWCVCVWQFPKKKPRSKPCSRTTIPFGAFQVRLGIVRLGIVR